MGKRGRKLRGYVDRSGTTGYRYRFRIPKHLHAIADRKVILTPLGSSEASAKLKAIHVAASNLKQVEEWERQLRRQMLQADPLLEDAARWRDDKAIDPETGERAADLLMEEEREWIEEEHGKEAASRWFAVAAGNWTPIAPAAKDWLASARMPPKPQADRVRAIAKFIEWLESKGYAPTMEAVTKPIAREYFATLPGRLSPSSVNSEVSRIHGLWKWLERNSDKAITDPWRGVWAELPKAKRKRPWTDAEMRKLLKGKPPQAWLRDCIVIVAAHGLRAQELGELRVSDVDLKAKVFTLRPEITKKGIERRIPIHSGEPLEIFKRRVKGKQPGEYIIHEPPTPPATATWTRSNRISQNFQEYRVALGLNDPMTDLHSLRRWATTKADQAGCSPDHMQRVFWGLQRGNMLHLYSGGITDAQLRKVIEAIKLPK